MAESYHVIHTLEGTRWLGTGLLGGAGLGGTTSGCPDFELGLSSAVGALDGLSLEDVGTNE